MEGRRQWRAVGGSQARGSNRDFPLDNSQNTAPNRIIALSS